MCFLVLPESVSELLGEHCFFLPRFETIPSHHQAESQDASPLADHQGRANRRQNQAGIDGMAQASIGAGADELVVLFDRDPVRSNTPPGDNGPRSPARCPTR